MTDIFFETSIVREFSVGLVKEGPKFIREGANGVKTFGGASVKTAVTIFLDSSGVGGAAAKAAFNSFLTLRKLGPEGEQILVELVSRQSRNPQKPFGDILTDISKSPQLKKSFEKVKAQFEELSPKLKDDFKSDLKSGLFFLAVSTYVYKVGSKNLKALGKSSGDGFFKKLNDGDEIALEVSDTGFYFTTGKGIDSDVQVGGHVYKDGDLSELTEQVRKGYTEFSAEASARLRQLGDDWDEASNTLRQMVDERWKKVAPYFEETPEARRVFDDVGAGDFNLTNTQEDQVYIMMVREDVTEGGNPRYVAVIYDQEGNILGHGEDTFNQLSLPDEDPLGLFTQQ